MNVAEIRDRAGWESLKPIWNGLLDASTAATTFLTWEWLTAWWSAYGSPDDLRILTASDDSGIIRGIAPLRRETIRRYGQKFCTLAFIGDGSNDSDYLDFIIAPGFEERVIDAWLRHTRADLERGVILRLNDIPAASPNVAILRQRAEGQLWHEEAVHCATIQLPDDWAEYLNRLRPRFRTKVRSVLRQLETRNDVRFAFCDQESQLERLLPALFDLHTRRWNHDGRPGVFGWDKKRQFYHELTSRLLQQGSLRLSCGWSGAAAFWPAQVRIRPRALLPSLAGRLRPRRGTLESRCRNFAPGRFARCWGPDCASTDFLAGVGRHKTDWGAEIKESRRVLVATRTYKNLLFCRAPEWRERAAATAKRVLPDRLLTMRQALPDRHAAQATIAASRELVRRAAARCYFHLGMPAAAQRLRKRYQLSISPAGRRPRISWTERREPAGRIFCYHRVNDDHDPFFPSMPVEIFERQLRFVTQRYKVVSLTDLIAHLDSGSPETVVAVTFDDGYQDNYRNAFPILQRYGVPATIFLTTGCIDSGEPLWFERLAEAVKTTAKEYVDLEIDLPRRFWMRTGEERLRSARALFDLLRQVRNDQRQAHLASLLRDLGASKSEHRDDVMLTWDQVRRMAPHNVDFGGHTVTHPLLSRVPQEQVGWEVSE